MFRFISNTQICCIQSMSPCYPRGLVFRAKLFLNGKQRGSLQVQISHVRSVSARHHRQRSLVFLSESTLNWFFSSVKGRDP